MRILTLVFGLVMSLVACAQDNSVELYQAGVHYDVLPSAVTTITPGKIEVTEAFSYGCGHCFRFEPLWKAWKAKQADDVAPVKLPVIFRDNFKPLARVLFTAKALGLEAEVNERMFAGIHNEKKNMASESVMASMFKELGIDEEKFMKTYKSFSVSSQVQQAEARMRSMNITGTPQLIVDGRYSISAGKAGGHAEMLKIADFLIAKVRAEKQ